MNYVGLIIKHVPLNIEYLITKQITDRCYVNHLDCSFFWDKEIDKIIKTKGTAFNGRYQILNLEILSNPINIF